MDGQNFENENNVTVDTTATEVSSAAETVQETPVTIASTLVSLFSGCCTGAVAAA